MTGWRLGWLVLLIRPGAAVERLVQNPFICAIDRTRRTRLLRAR
jgi:aspartate/methionine/tyrosine aminotransferase